MIKNLRIWKKTTTATRPLKGFNDKSCLRCSFIMFNCQNLLQFTPFGDFRSNIRSLFRPTWHLSADLFSLRMDKILKFLTNMCKKDSNVSKNSNSCISFDMQLQKIRKKWKIVDRSFWCFMCRHSTRRKEGRRSWLSNMIKMYQCAQLEIVFFH